MRIRSEPGPRGRGLVRYLMLLGICGAGLSWLLISCSQSIEDYLADHPKRELLVSWLGLALAGGLAVAFVLYLLCDFSDEARVERWLQRSQRQHRRRRQLRSRYVLVRPAGGILEEAQLVRPATSAEPETGQLLRVAEAPEATTPVGNRLHRG